MARLSELPPEMIHEIITRVPEGQVVYSHPATPPDWSTISRPSKDQNDKDQIQLYQLMRVNRLFQDCVLRYLNTPRQWPHYLPAAEDINTTMTFEEQTAQCVEREGDCFERLRIRAAASEFRALATDVATLTIRFIKIHMRLTLDSAPWTADLLDEKICESVSPLISRKAKLLERLAALQTGMHTQRRGNVDVQSIYLRLPEHTFIQTRISGPFATIERIIRHIQTLQERRSEDGMCIETR